MRFYDAIESQPAPLLRPPPSSSSSLAAAAATAAAASSAATPVAASDSVTYVPAPPPAYVVPASKPTSIVVDTPEPAESAVTARVVGGVKTEPAFQNMMSFRLSASCDNDTENLVATNRCDGKGGSGGEGGGGSRSRGYDTSACMRQLILSASEDPMCQQFAQKVEAFLIAWARLEAGSGGGGGGGGGGQAPPVSSVQFQGQIREWSYMVLFQQQKRVLL